VSGTLTLDSSVLSFVCWPPVSFQQARDALAAWKQLREDADGFRIPRRLHHLPL